MALDFTVIYPGQVDDGDPDYPQGKARNVVVEGDGTGTPWEEQLVNDWFGFHQALLLTTGITPSGNPDTANESQYTQAIQQIADRSRNHASVTEQTFGAIGNGTFDCTTAIQSAIDVLHAAGGGTVYFPPGTYRITADLVLSPLVNLRGVPGLSTIRMHHATEKFFTTLSAWSAQTEIFGLDFEAGLSNTGNFFDETAGLARVRFTRCRLNKAALLLAGRLFASVSNSQIELVDCDFTAVKTNDNHFALPLKLIRGKITMAPAATADLITCVNDLVIDGTEFVQVSTVGDVAFIEAGAGSTRIRGAKFNVDDSAAGASTRAIKIGGGLIQASGCDFNSNVIPYEYVSLAAAGSSLQLKPALRIESTSDVTLPQGFESFIVETSKATAPSIAPADPLFAGQRMTVILKNISGGTWAGNPTTVGVLDSNTGLSGLDDGDYATYSWVALDINDDGGAAWVQSSAPGVI